MSVFKIPLAWNSTSPLLGRDWHKRISNDPTQHKHWIQAGLNVGAGRRNLSGLRNQQGRNNSEAAVVEHAARRLSTMVGG